MTLQQLRYVITISEAGSFSRASEILYMAQPSLTGSVKELEKELGIVIFHRGGRGVTLTNDGAEFMSYARQIYQDYESVMDRYGEGSTLKKKFGVTTQHYSFTVKTFVELVKRFSGDEYEFAIRESKTREVIDDVITLRSEIGILYLSDFNKNVMTKIFKSNDLEFVKLVESKPYVYIWKGNPLSEKKAITFNDLRDYPCLSFEQGGNESFYFAEEILATKIYSHIIKANDRATMLNLMIGLNGYTLCSGIVCEELNGDEYLSIPFKMDEGEEEAVMKIGYIHKNGQRLSNLAQTYISMLNDYLKQQMSC